MFLPRLVYPTREQCHRQQLLRSPAPKPPLPRPGDSNIQNANQTLPLVVNRDIDRGRRRQALTLFHPLQPFQRIHAAKKHVFESRFIALELQKAVEIAFAYASWLSGIDQRTPEGSH